MKAHCSPADVAYAKKIDVLRKKKVGKISSMEDVQALLVQTGYHSRCERDKEIVNFITENYSPF